MKKCCSKTPYYLDTEKEDSMAIKCAQKTCQKFVCAEHSDFVNFLQPIEDHLFVVLCNDCFPDISEKVTKVFLNLRDTRKEGFTRPFVIKKILDVLSDILVPNFASIHIMMNTSIKKCHKMVASGEIKNMMEKNQHLH